MWRLPTLLSFAVLVEGDVTTFNPNEKSKIKIPDDFARCGCVWSEREGCTTSAEQVSQALADSEITKICEETGGAGILNQTDKGVYEGMKVVEARAKKECEVRSRIKDYHPHIAQCASLDAQGCKEHEEFCQYNAQGKNQCGIDMEKLMKKVAGPGRQSHPLMELVLEADKCATVGHNLCDTNHECEFSEETGCGLSKKRAFTQILSHPQVLGMLFLINIGSQCRANYEHGSGTCKSMCQKEFGVCTTDPRKSQSAQVSRLVDTLCQSAYEASGEAKTCPQPCAMGSRRDLRDGRDEKDGEKLCRASESPSTEVALSENDVFICQTYSVVHSTLIAYERHCNMMDAEKEMCVASDKVCAANLNDTWSLHGGKSQQGNEDPAPGLTGILGEISAAVDQHTAPLVTLFESYLGKNPGHVEDLLRAASSASHRLDFEPGEEPGDSVSRVEQTTAGPRPAGKSARDFFSDQYWFGSKSNPDSTSHWLLFVAGLLSAGGLYASFKFGVSLNQWIPCLAPASALSAPVLDDESDLEG
mmetsp:Transcript_32105/g.73417  ORF Transcript_32105/g.73417 Transcript_32105/m.73417 type:complete len:531 (+) Transcript_32105:51-1643(+)